MLLMAGWISACNSLAVSFTLGGQFGVLMLTKFMTGKKSVAPAGTSQESVADPPPAAPARNHIELRWPTIQLFPVVSNKGFTGAGIERAHCHHSPVSVGNWPGGRPCAITARYGMKNPRAIAIIALVMR